VQAGGGDFPKVTTKLRFKEEMQRTDISGFLISISLSALLAR
jgi:hypothetical protein